MTDTFASSRSDSAGILGIDISVHNGSMNFAKAKAAGARFVYARATLADTYQDPLFVEHVRGAQAVGLPVGAYHVVAPDRKPSAQIANFRSLVIEVDLQLPPVLDCEMHRKQSVARITANIRDCIDLLLYARPIIYTAKYWWQDYVSRTDAWRLYPLWIAQYTTAQQPSLPVDWKNWLLWQWSADRPPNMRGAEFGAKSTSIDINRFNGDETAFRKWAGPSAGSGDAPTPPPPALTVEERLTRLEQEARRQGWAI